MCLPHCAARTTALTPAPLHGLLPPPLQVIFGIVGGLLAGIILGCTRWFNSRYKRLVGLYGAALLLMYFLEYYNLLSGGWVGGWVQAYKEQVVVMRWVGGGGAAPACQHASYVVPDAACHCLTSTQPA